MSRILCIDDEQAILRLLEVILTQDGHQTVPARDARSALVILSEGSIDAVLLDLGLPDRDGLELISTIRARTTVPILVVSARSEVAEKVTALDLGATDYITKPFDGEELRARLRVTLRNSGVSPGRKSLLVCGSIQMDPDRHEVRVDDKLVALTPKEFTLLQALLEADGRILTHTALLERVWGKAHARDVEYLRVAVRAIRLKVEKDPSQPKLLINEPGIGYRLLA